MITRIIIFLFIPAILFSQSIKDIISESDVVWNEPSKKSIESMLMGNGEIGINLWAEKTGDIYIYIGRTDSWDEHARLAKVGLVKVNITPNPFETNFYQRLDLYNGQILIESGTADRKLNLKIWVDANNPVVNIEYDSKSEYSYKVTPVIWRSTKREIPMEERHSLYGFINSDRELYVMPDSVLDNIGDNIVWFHRNESSIWREVLERQGMAGWTKSHRDPLLYNTYGCLVRGSGLKSVEKACLKTTPEKEGRIRIFSTTKNCDNTIEWLSEISDISKTYEKKKHGEYYKNHLAYWNSFWKKSYIRLSGSEQAVRISKAYTLQRFVTASSGRGKYPIKFNGSIFTVDSCDEVKKYDADYRMWGGPYWHQNTRLIYWPLMVSGDYDIMKPFFKLYLDLLPYAKANTKRLFNHEGAFYPETFYFWGSYAMDNFGWKTSADGFKHIENQYIRYHYQGALETLAMMFDYYYFTKDDDFIKMDVLPFAKEVVTFYKERFPVGEDKKLHLFPSQALETIWDIANPTPDIAGLRWNLEKIIDLPEKVISKKEKLFYESTLKSIPEISFGYKNGKKVILPCLNPPDAVSNSETPELYPIFPYRIYGLGKKDYEIAEATYNSSGFRFARCWQNNDVIAAHLGKTDSVKKYILQRLDYKHTLAKFPVFWGNNMDWSPDQDHGGNLMIALQAMLLQYDEKNISILPAFPKEWNVEFKLNAPEKTSVTCSYKNGRVEKLDVFPKSRKKDIKVY